MLNGMRMGSQMTDVKVDIIRVTTEAQFVTDGVPSEFARTPCVVYEIRCNDKSCGENGYLASENNHLDANDIRNSHLESHEVKSKNDSGIVGIEIRASLDYCSPTGIHVSAHCQGCSNEMVDSGASLREISASLQIHIDNHLNEAEEVKSAHKN